MVEPERLNYACISCNINKDQNVRNKALDSKSLTY